MNEFNEQNDSLDIREEIGKYLRHWKLFLLSAIFFLVAAYFKLRYSTPLYSVSSSILIKDNKNAGISTELAAFEDLGIVGGTSANNPDNEIEILKSRNILGKVIDSLQLNVSYFTEGRVSTSEMYKENSPIFFVKTGVFNKSNSNSFIVKIVDSINYEFVGIDGDLVSSHAFGESVTIDNETFIVESNKNKKPKEEEIVIVKISSKNSLINQLKSSIKITPLNENSSILLLNLNGSVIEKAEDILNELVKQYNTDAISDKNLISQNTKDFIDDRLRKIKSDLFLIDDKVKEFKDSKNITGLSEEFSLTLGTLKETNERISLVRTQISLVNWIKDLLVEKSTTDQILPTSLGFDYNGLTDGISKYNELILLRDKASLNAGPKNPILMQLESQIESVRSNLLSSLSPILKSLDIQLKDLNNEANIVLSRVKSIPATERGFIDIAREQEIIASLYQYLLKKKEETEISLAVTVPKAKIIDVAYGYKSPIGSNRQKTYLGAFFIGMLLPFGFVFLRNLLDNKIYSKKDISNTILIPFLGSIPTSDEIKTLIVTSGERTPTSEAFRLIRANLNFIIPNLDKLGKTILVTSTTSGEGKSFVSINTAAALALSGNKVLLMGMDFRAPKINEYLNLPDKKGITNYISDSKLIFDELKFKIPNIDSLDIISSGVIPPNPSELVTKDRVEALFLEVKQKYDFIVVDTAPVNLVSDTLLIAKYADMFMYIVRANYSDKRSLVVPQELYKENKLPNVAIILNDIDSRRDGYGYEGYSYGGYGYGGYGYGATEVKKPWYRRIFS
ncbi:MAG: polysaccharide biosynthesis tyrosine autokinase [Flavobacterium sp.]|mgnify:FL=1|jgi:tyrosine-protein kinase Etk/Wzc|nr:polysaccharide biosynthesis tyrosine autokinase [Flavobacterium sp.]